MQASLPCAALYVPAAHASHVAPFAVKPASHAQSARTVLPAGEVESLGHAVQIALPGAGLYVPAAHGSHAAPFAVKPALHVSMHGPPSAPPNPALHLQLLIVVLPATEPEFAAHVMHVSDADAPVVVEYLPATQS